MTKYFSALLGALLLSFALPALGRGQEFQQRMRQMVGTERVQAMPVQWMQSEQQVQRLFIIPEPVTLIAKEGQFVLDGDTYISVHSPIRVDSPDMLLRKTVHLFQEKLEQMTGLRLPLKEAGGGTGSQCIRIEQYPDTGNREAYTLDITEDNITLRASTAAGIFYAMESLLQLVSSSPPPADLRGKASPGRDSIRPVSGNFLSVPCAFISDHPRFAYRGMHLDVSRHFFPPSFIKKYLDILAEFKINVFHWHLTDSHGWRLEIKKYPRLTSVGAWRADRPGIPMTLAEPTGKNERAGYGGFYTQEEVKEIIEYAQLRNIEIIPEIEMPGHCTAALVAYPQFSDLDNPVPLLMPCGYKGDRMHNFCAGYDSTYIFLQDILKEVMAIFPSRFIHIGGDEVRPGPWLGCSRCKNKMQQKGLKTARELQAYFTHRIDSFITANGKRMVGWDEILDADLQNPSVAMSWHGDSKAEEAAAKGNQVIMTPYRYTYFDFYQSPPGLEEDITYARLNLDSVYAFDPMPKSFNARWAAYILGGQGCLWTENIVTEQRVEYMLLPRLGALAEALWTPPNRKDYVRFISKTEKHFKSFERRGINYARSMYNVDIIPAYDSLLKKIRISLTDQTYSYPIHYTLDGTNPTLRSPRYAAPFFIDQNTTVKALTFQGDTAAGKINTDHFSLHKAVGSKIASRPVHAGINRLTDGIFGTVEPYDRRWLVITDSVLTVDIDLKKERRLRRIRICFMEDQVSDIFLPATISIAGSRDGLRFKGMDTVAPTATGKEGRHTVVYQSAPRTRARFIRIVIRNGSPNKEKANNSMLPDEIVIE